MPRQVFILLFILNLECNCFMMCLFLPYNKWISYIHTYMHTCIHTYPPSRVSLHLIHPILLGCRKSHRAPSWVPCAKERLPTGYLFYTWQCIGWRRQWRSTPVLLPGKSHGRGSLVGCSPWGRKKSRTQLSDFTFTSHFHALEKEMVTHSSVLAWRIPGMREPGGLLSMGSHRVRHDWSDAAGAVYW